MPYPIWGTGCVTCPCNSNGRRKPGGGGVCMSGGCLSVTGCVKSVYHFAHPVSHPTNLQPVSTCINIHPLNAIGATVVKLKFMHAVWNSITQINMRRR